MGKQDDIINQEQEAEIEEEPVQVGKTKELEEKVEELDGKYKRALADYQNLQKRASDDRLELIKSANKDILLRLLPVLDTLVLANIHVQNDGLKISVTQFLDTLKAEGVTRIETIGNEFNPHTMECVTIEVGDENKVLEEVRAGYLLNEKVLRPAQVKVGNGSKTSEDVKKK